MKKVLSLLSIICTISFPSLAAKPTCSPNYNGYCSYTGTVARIYINSGNLILIYFDEPVNLSEPSKAGLSITETSAAAYKVNDNPEFAKLFYSTALAAQASKRKVTIQMRGTTHGYLKFDRIWLSE